MLMEREIDLKAYFAILRKRVWLIIILPAAAALATAYISFFVLTPFYEADTTLYVINKTGQSELPIAYNDVLVGQYLVKDYRELVKSRTVTNQVIEELGISDMEPENLASKINVNSKNDTRIIEIKVQDPNPVQAAEIADKLGEVFVSKVIELMKVDNVSIVDTAKIPENPVKPNPVTNIAAAFFIGLLAAAGIIFLLEYLDDTLKTPEDIEKYLQLSVLGTIPEFSIK
jgi:capsular polysaccharide biosynthesis protein